MLNSVITVVLACGGAAVTAPAARAATPCTADSSAPGSPARASGDMLSVSRGDGRIDQFQQFYDEPGPASYLPFLWHRQQDEPGGAYGAWERVSGTAVGPKLYQVIPVANGSGRLEVFFSSRGGFCHTVQDPDGEGWSPAEGFGLSPAPYHGGLYLFRERDGRLHAFASATGADAMQVRTEDATGSDGWGPVRGMGRLPDPYAGLGSPTSVTQLTDGRLSIVAREWNRDRSWQITEDEHAGSWGPWELCARKDCA
ncbi:hypothetical protein [Streptomyces cinnamoneus]|uniref:Exo-alpha-sialidase n=1 Tax=Streptomyces cinnamoneus TaxID=53446 RepID=A0A918U0I7_STRCJ|nr:hypothetical protein [Streptomyces cinnamoneus]GHC71251.1 hypothetical protein GCM10010507_57740 [Streptomyces cinnamoneus]